MEKKENIHKKMFLFPTRISNDPLFSSLDTILHISRVANYSCKYIEESGKKENFSLSPRKINYFRKIVLQDRKIKTDSDFCLDQPTDS